MINQKNISYNIVNYTHPKYQMWLTCICKKDLGAKISFIKNNNTVDKYV